MRANRAPALRLSRRRALAGLGLAAATAACDVGFPGGDAGSGGSADALRDAPPYLPPAPQPLPPAVGLPLVILDFAGSGLMGDTGDGGPAALAQFRSVGGVAVGPDGSTYVADPSASRIRRIHPDGTVQALAGTGVRGYAGDGGPALAASFTDPGRLLVDQVGVIFVAEPGRVRRIDSGGGVSTILGNGQPDFAGDGGPAVFGRTAGNAGMAIDGNGNLFIAERASHRVRRIDTSGILDTVAGTGAPGGAGDGGPARQAMLDQPVDVDVDSQGNLLVAELAGNRIRRVSADGRIETIAGVGRPGGAGDGGPALAAELNGPQSVLTDSSGAIFVADWNNRRIRRIDPDGTIHTVAGHADGRVDSGGLAVESRLILPLVISPMLDGSLIVVEQGQRRIRRLAPAAQGAAPPSVQGAVQPAQGAAQPADGAASPAAPAAGEAAYAQPSAVLPPAPPLPAELIAEVFAGTGESGYAGDGGFRGEAVFASPRAIAVDGSGRLLIADTGNHRIRRIGLDGVVSTIAGDGTPGYAGDGGPAAAAQFNRPAALAVDADGAIYVADAGNFRLRKIGPDAIVRTVAGTGTPGDGGDGGPAIAAEFTDPGGLAIAADGSIYVADGPVHRVRRIGPDGVIRPYAGNGVDGLDGDGGPAAQAALGFPQRLAVAPDRAILVTQLHAGVVRRIGVDGVIQTLAGAPQDGAPPEGPAREIALDSPIGLSADAAGNVYVVGSGDGRLTRVDPAGQARTLAGNPLGQGQSGDPARDIPLFTAVDVALSPDGSAYVLEARGLVWRIRSILVGDPAPAADATPTPDTTQQPAQNESAQVASVVLALGLDSQQAPVQPTLEFRPGERVNVSVEFVDVAPGSRLGVRWYAGDTLQGTFLTDPQPAYTQARFGFWFALAPTSPEGPWRVEIVVGAATQTSVDFVVVPGAPRSVP